MKTKMIPVICLLAIVGCKASPSPDNVYNEYNNKVIAGLEYEEQASYYSKKRKQEVEEQIKEYTKQTNKSREEVIKIFLPFSQAVAKCKEISLAEEIIDGDTATLKYNQKDICGNISTTKEYTTVKLVNENGWKLDSVEQSL